MRHCFEFDAFDIWYLKDNDEFSDRTMFIGDCPRCGKHIVELFQRNKRTNTFVKIKKVGDTAYALTAQLANEVLYSRNSLNKMNLKPKPYGWVYGINKEKKLKNGNKVVEQYAADFYGNTELVKKEKK